MTIPKSIADLYGIAFGDEIEFVPAGDAIRVQRPGARAAQLDTNARLAEFDRATDRQLARQYDAPPTAVGDRDWRREDLYERDSAR